MWILIFIIALYSALILAISFGDKPSKLKVARRETEGVSVILPFKNEKSNLKRLLREIADPARINRPIEFIFVDDHSTDGSTDLLEESEYFKLIRLPQETSGKKEAIRTGVNSAAYEVILTLDADVILSRGFFEKTQIAPPNGRMLLIHSLAPIKREGFLSAFFDLEFISLQIAGRRTAQWGFPVLSNGACLSFRKDAFYAAEEVRSDYSLPTGDDVFLTEAIASIYGSSVIETTEAIPSLQVHFPEKGKQLLQQRARWISKTTDLGSLSFQIVAFLVALAHITFFPLALFSFLDGGILEGTLIILMKSGSEWIMFSKYLKPFGRRDLTTQILPAQFIYPFYLCLLLPLGWIKRRSYKTQHLHVGGTI